MSIILLPPQYFVVNKAEMTQNRDLNDLFGTINRIKITHVTCMVISLS